MKKLSSCLAAILILPLHTVQAAYQSMDVKMRQVIIEEGAQRREISRPSYNFSAEIISDLEGLKAESIRQGRPFVTVKPGERYAIRLFNPLPVRVAVNLTIDGINSISGKPSGISDGEKWLISPYSEITIRGWQVNGEEARRFFFTEKPRSYAKWRGKVIGKDLAANCGVIGAAYFWSQKELDSYYEAHPQYRYARRCEVHRGITGQLQSADTPMASAASSQTDTNYYSQGTQLYNVGRLGESYESFEKAVQNNQNSTEADAYLRQIRQQVVTSAKRKSDDKAGTGMGERESNVTQTVQFDYDTGMYKLSQAVVIYYEFAEAPAPNPFPALSYAPEMP